VLVVQGLPAGSGAEWSVAARCGGCTGTTLLDQATSEYK
jgi:hypothetical protein